MSGLAPLKRHHGVLEPTGFEKFSDIFDDFFRSTWLPRKALLVDNFKLDVKEAEKEYCVEAEMPGVKKEEISISLDDEMLTIAVKREKEIKEERKNYIHQERNVSSMKRSVYLEGAKLEGIQAKLSDGVLNIVIPKADKAEKATNIPID